MKSQDDEPEQDPFLCRCAKCKKFWADSFNRSEQELIRLPPHQRAARSGCMYHSVKTREDHPAVLKLGDRVLVRDKMKGTVKYIGAVTDTLIAPELYVGVQTDNQMGSVHNGIYNKKRYFHCPRGHGMFVRYSEVVRINPPEKKPPLKGNYMFPSFEAVKQRRKQRSLMDPDFDLGPMYSAKKSSKNPSDSASDKSDTASLKSKRRSVSSASGEKIEEERDYEKEAPRELIHRWSREHFGGGRAGEAQARMLYKLHAAYKKGVEYKRTEEKAEKGSSDDDEDCSEDDREGEKRDRRISSTRPKQKHNSHHK